MNLRYTLLSSYYYYTKCRDTLDIEKSQRLMILPSLSVDLQGHQYMRSNLPLYIVKIFSQLRLSNSVVCRIVSSPNIYIFDVNNFCKIFYDINTNDTMIHSICECPRFESDRLEFLTNIDMKDCTDLRQKLFDSTDPVIITKLIHFFMKILTLRQNIILGLSS